VGTLGKTFGGYGLVWRKDQRVAFIRDEQSLSWGLKGIYEVSQAFLPTKEKRSISITAKWVFLFGLIDRRERNGRNSENSKVRGIYLGYWTIAEKALWT